MPNEKELKEIIAVADQTSLKNVVRLAAATGMRRGEFVALRWDNVDLDDMDRFVFESLMRLCVYVEKVKQ